MLLRRCGLPRLAALCSLLLSLNAAALEQGALTHAVQEEEQILKARIGVAVIDSATGKTISYRGDERFPLNSTHKAFLCAALLSQVDQGERFLANPVTIDRSQLVDYSPVTEKHLAPARMTWQQLCSAAVSYSDNTAANLIAGAVGGPAGMTNLFRRWGDEISRLDRYEPALNEATPGDPRDTTTPLAISATLRRLVTGNLLSRNGKKQLIAWMVEDKVADALLRAALPPGWRIADKTGAGGYGSRSIVAVVWPPDNTPLIVAIYITQTDATLNESNAAIARLGRMIFAQR